MCGGLASKWRMKWDSQITVLRVFGGGCFPRHKCCIPPIILCVFGCVTFLAYRYLSRKPADLSDDLILITGNLLSIAYRGCQALQMGLVGF